MRTITVITAFISAWLLAGWLYWLKADWWAYRYVNPGQPMEPKFEMPGWWQFGESAIVGLLACGVASLASVVVVRLWRRGR
jgi:hypothetical protein